MIILFDWKKYYTEKILFGFNPNGKILLKFSKPKKKKILILTTGDITLTSCDFQRLKLVIDNITASCI